MSHSRRSFLRRSGLGLGALASSRLMANSSETLTGRTLDEQLNHLEHLPKSTRFPLGIMSGDPTEEGTVLWSYYEGLLQPVLLVWENGNKPKPYPSPRADGGYIHIHFQGLKADTHYNYCFAEMEPGNKLVARSRSGTFRTTPGLAQNPVIQLGAVSCLKNKYEPVMLEHAAQQDTHAFMFLGDSTYNDRLTSLNGFRGRWASNFKKKGFLDLHSKTSIIRTIDDHEIDDNFNPETTPRHVINAGLQAFFEHTPMRRHTKNPNQIWRSTKFGSTVEVFTLDCRTERRPSTRRQRSATYISREQMDWLKEGLKNSPCQFKVIMNSVPISSFPFPYKNDRWQGYPHQREEILSHIERGHIHGVLWVAGDFHFGSVGRISKRGHGKKHYEVLAGPGCQTPNPLGAALNLSRQFDWAKPANNYAILRCDPRADAIDIHFFAGGDGPYNTRLRNIERNYKKRIQF